MPLFHLFVQGFAVCRTAVFFPCGSIYLMQDNRIGIGKSVGKFRKQRCGARIGMRHKVRDNPPFGIKLVDTLECFINCGGMVSVIVHEEDAVHFAQNFATPFCSLKRSETVPDHGEIGSGNLFSLLLDKSDYQRDSGGGIEDAVLSRNTNAEFSAEAA